MPARRKPVKPVVEEPEPEPEVQPEEQDEANAKPYPRDPDDYLKIEAPHGKTSVFRLGGVCKVCGKKLYKCISQPNCNYDALFEMGYSTPVYTQQGLYCVEHNPYKHLQNNKGIPPGEEKPGDLYFSPQGRVDR